MSRHSGLLRLVRALTCSRSGNAAIETAFVAPHAPLARGWERQTDRLDNSLDLSTLPTIWDRLIEKGGETLEATRSEPRRRSRSVAVQQQNKRPRTSSGAARCSNRPKDQFCLPRGVELSGNGHTSCVNLRLSRPWS